MFCPKCKQRIRGANRIRIRGVWIHKKCPASSVIARDTGKEILEGKKTIEL